MRQLKEQLPLAQNPAAEARLRELWEIDRDIQRGLEAIAKAFARKGDLVSAMPFADELNNPASRLHLIQELSTLHVKAGAKERTLRWARGLSNPSEKVFALVGIAIASAHKPENKKQTSLFPKT